METNYNVPSFSRYLFIIHIGFLAESRTHTAAAPRIVRQNPAPCPRNRGAIARRSGHARFEQARAKTARTRCGGPEATAARTAPGPVSAVWSWHSALRGNVFGPRGAKGRSASAGTRNPTLRNIVDNNARLSGRKKEKLSATPSLPLWVIDIFLSRSSLIAIAAGRDTHARPKILPIAQKGCDYYDSDKPGARTRNRRPPPFSLGPRQPYGPSRTCRGVGATRRPRAFARHHDLVVRPSTLRRNSSGREMGHIRAIPLNVPRKRSMFARRSHFDNNDKAVTT